MEMKKQVRLKWLRIVLGMAALVLIVLPFARIVKSPRNDFVNHYESGRRFRYGEPLYEGGHNYPYPPFWAMAHAPFTVFPLRVAQPIAYLIGVLALVALVRSFQGWSFETGSCSAELAHDAGADPWTNPKCHATNPAVLDRESSTMELGRGQVEVGNGGVVLGLLLGSSFLLRDLDECAANTFLLSLTWLGLTSWTRGRDLWGGVLIGLATALKCTAAIAILYAVWKRQWRLAAAAALATVVLSLAPAPWMGWRSYVDHLRQWARPVIGGMTNPDPSVGVLGPQPLSNKGLRPAIARYLMHLPADHPGRVDSPLYVDFLNFSPRLAGLIATLILAGLGGVVAWWTSGALEGRDDPRWLAGGALVLLFGLLASPITWGQHCVAALPALVLLSRRLLAGTLSPAGVVSLVLFCALVFGLNRGLIGRPLWVVAESFHPVPFAIIALWSALLMRPRHSGRGGPVARRMDEDRHSDRVAA